MKIIATDIPQLKILIPEVFTDERGYFTETFRQELIEQEVATQFVQENESFSKKGVLRGLHYQKAPFAQAKLVRCVLGKILDVAVDLRKDSKTFGRHVALQLSGENKKQLFVPKGFAHGFVVLSDWAIVSYKVDNYYNKEAEVSLKYDDALLNIDWQLCATEITVSEKDKDGEAFAEVSYF